MTGFYTKSVVVGLFLLIVLTVQGVSRSARAETLATAVQTASEGVYVDSGQPTTNLNQGLLAIQANGFGAASKISLLKFDLSTVGFTIDTARLNLSVINDPSFCVTPSTAVTEIRLYAVDSTTWSETTVVYNDIGVTVNRGTLLDDLDENPLSPGPPFLGPPNHAHFTDDVGGGTFASYLDTERTTGDKVAGLWLEVTSGLDQVWFDDDEGTGAGFGCAGADLLPTLQMADSGSPTAVNLQSLSVSDEGGSSIIVAIGASLLALASGGLLLRRRWRSRP